ncbi:hypothetical protein JNUCC0626_08980 [Lentzea sp. JNUCC 0626]|uniref:hypothetical protein n=1 Tax=Lentzea sp. JNUCC 0626 TaxID=3367513 RepID=UPI0037491EEB
MNLAFAPTRTVITKPWVPSMIVALMLQASRGSQSVEALLAVGKKAKSTEPLPTESRVSLAPVVSGSAMGLAADTCTSHVPSEHVARSVPSAAAGNAVGGGLDVLDVLTAVVALEEGAVGVA